MDKFFKFFSKSNNKRDSENKAKEEEDLVFDTSLSFEVTPVKQNDKLKELVKDIKVGGVNVENFEAYNSGIDKLLSQYNETITELEYRFIKYCEKNEIMPDINTSNVEKMKEIGKIGENPTTLDETSLRGEISYSYNKFRMDARNGFCSVRTNNCVFKKKWVFEVQVVSNGLHQIGWCQLNTPFTSTDGVGDDMTSYAYDGYRVVLWHNGHQAYGQIMDVGDVIGCCLNLDDKTIEYFKNGQSLGIGKDKVPVGENIAYFPGVSISQNEKLIFNFGKSPFQYSYPGYDPLDLPDSIFNGTAEITAELIDLLKISLLKIISSNDPSITPYHKISLTNKIFSFLSQISFRDIFIFKTLIIPFLFELASSENNQFEKLLENLLIYVGHQKEKLQFTAFMFDNICGMIEENSLKGDKGIEDWKYLMTIFIRLMHNDTIVQLWVENGKTVENLRSIFTSNTFKMQDVYDVLKNKYNDFETDVTAYKALKEIKEEFYEKVMMAENQVEAVYSEYLKQILLMFLQDKRSIKLKSTEENVTTLKAILVDFVNKGYDLGVPNLLFEALQTHKKDNSQFLKNFIFNLYSVFTDYMHMDLDTFGIDVWFNRLQQGNFFYDEIGIGGTINHVTSEYISTIDEKYKEKNTSFHSELNHRVVKITNVLLHHMRDYMKILEIMKNHSLKQIINFEHGNDDFRKLFRTYFHLFNEKNQVLLYKYGFFMIKFINSLIRKNRNLVYFMPKSLFDIPYDIYRFLNKIKSQVVYNSTKRREINNSNTLFVNDDFSSEVVYFYTSLFGDPQVANPELKESLIVKMKYFMKKRSTSKIFEENTATIEYLLKGLLNYMTIESLCHVACEIMVKIVKPSCFGYENANIEKANLVKVTKKFFENDVKTFHEFMDNYTKLINKVMTDYTITLNECSNKVLNQGGLNVHPDVLESKTALLKKLTFAYSLLCDLMKIFEFLLAAYPKEFLDISTLNYSRFVNFLKNTSSRILEHPYIDHLIALLEKTKASNNFPGGSESLLLMAYSIIGIILNIETNKDNPKFQEFIKRFSNLPDLDMDPFLDLYKTVTEMKVDPKLAEGIEKYKSIIEYFISNREKKRERKMSTEEWEETNKNENICIICYANNSDRILIPCGHVCCNECLMQYLTEKKHCFICNASIEKTEVLQKNNK